LALEFVPVHRFVPAMRPHFPLANWIEKPGAPQLVQDVTGLGRVMRLGSGFYHLNHFDGWL
jgi:hypothetical protein